MSVQRGLRRDFRELHNLLDRAYSQLYGQDLVLLRIRLGEEEGVETIESAELDQIGYCVWQDALYDNFLMALKPELL